MVVFTGQISDTAAIAERLDTAILNQIPEGKINR